MSYYDADFGGYIADVPNLWFKRCDGKIFYFDELTAASFSPAGDAMEINAGQSSYPKAIIPSGKTLEAQFTSGKFTMDMFEMANDASLTTNSSYKRWKTARIDIKTNAGKIEDPLADASSVMISGLKLVSTTPATGEFKATAVTEVAGPPKVPAHIALTFFAGDIEDDTTITVMYQATETASVMNVKTDSSTARGELTMEWPVYSSGDDCTQASTKGWAILTIHRCRITALPGFDTSLENWLLAQKCA